MAIGGALRAAIRAGRFGTAARESRQRARALRSLNETGGVGNFQRRLPLEERGFERMSGFGYGETPRGNALVDNTFTGTRTVMPQGLDDYMFARPLPRGPMAAPYEDFRVVPGYSSMYTPEYIGGEMPMVSRGFIPTMPSSVPPPLVKRSPAMMDYTVPRAFGGGFDWGGGAMRASEPRPPRFFFDDYEISRNPFQPGETMPAWYRDEIMRGWQ